MLRRFCDICNEERDCNTVSEDGVLVSNICPECENDADVSGTFIVDDEGNMRRIW